jgi:hypothetical protein
MRSALKARYYTSGRVLHKKKMLGTWDETDRHEGEDAKKIRREEESLL